MSFRCMDVIGLFPSSSIQLLGGAEGMDHIVRWVYVAEATESILYSLNWLSGNELVIITGSNIVGDSDPVILQFIHSCAKKHVSGVVINTGRYIKRVPPEAILLADKLKLPLFLTPWETRLVEFTKEICTAIIDQAAETESASKLAESLLFPNLPITESHRSALEKIGFDKSSGYLVIVFQPDKATAQSSDPLTMELRTYLGDLVRSCYERAHQPALITALADSVVAIVKCVPSDEGCRKLLSSILDYFQTRMPDWKLQIGIGKKCEKIEDIPSGFHTAKQSLLVNTFDTANSITYFDKIGIYSILLSVENEEILNNYYHTLFDTLLDYDRSNGTALMHTLYAYIRHDTRLSATAKYLYIHENTLKYRLNKIKALMNLDIGLLDVQCRLNIGIKIGKILGEGEPSDSSDATDPTAETL